MGAADLKNHVGFLLTQCARFYAAALFVATFPNIGRLAMQSLNTPNTISSTTPSNHSQRTLLSSLRCLKSNLLHSARNSLFGLLVCRTVLALLSGLDTLGLASSLLGLLPLLVGFLCGGFPSLLLLGLASLLATELLAPLLLLFGLDLREQVGGLADLVVDGKRLSLPVIGDDKELCVKLVEDVLGCARPVIYVSVRGNDVAYDVKTYMYGSIKLARRWMWLNANPTTAAQRSGSVVARLLSSLLSCSSWLPRLDRCNAVLSA